MRIFMLLLLLVPFAVRAETTDDLFTAPPKPLDLAIIGDAEAAASAIIGPKGGTLKLTSTAGDTFVLTVPEAALLTDTRITATPIAESAGMPDGTGRITGLILQPDGLELGATATLEITPKTPIPPESRLHWGFYGRGSDAFLHIPVLDADGIVIPIDHFSGAGVSFADKIDLQFDRWRQKRVEDRIRSHVAELLYESHMDAIDFGDISDRGNAQAEEATKFLNEVGSRLILTGQLKLANHAAADCATMESATRAILAIDKQGQLLGSEDPILDPEVMRQLFDRYWTVCFPEKVKICQSTGDLPQLAAFGLAYERQRQLVGISAEDVSNPARAAELRAAMEACGRYKLTANASGEWTDNSGVHGTTAYKVDVPIRLKFTNPDLLTYTLEGEGPPTGQSVTFVDEACWKLDSSHAGKPMLARLQGLEFRTDHRPLRVELHLRAAEVLAVITCPENRLRKTIEHDVAWAVWGVAHARERVGWNFVLKAMQAGSHPAIFHTSWDGKGAGDGIKASDTTELTLEHLGG